MRGLTAWIFPALIAVACEVAVVPAWPTALHPHLPLVLACCAGLVYGVRTGAAVGAMTGLLLDLWIGRLLGSSACLYAGAGWLAGWVGQGLYRDVPGLSSLVASTATVLVEILRGSAVVLAGGTLLPGQVLAGWWHVLVPDALAAGLLAPLVFRYVLWKERRERQARALPVTSSASPWGGWRG